MDGVNKKIFRHGHKHEWCQKKIVEGCSGHGNGDCSDKDTSGSGTTMLILT